MLKGFILAVILTIAVFFVWNTFLTAMIGTMIAWGQAAFVGILAVGMYASHKAFK